MADTTTLKCACADCGEVISYPPSQIGQIVKCPKCGEESRLPPAPAPVEDEDDDYTVAPRKCPKCGSRLGREVTCAPCAARSKAQRAALIRTSIGVVCAAGVVIVLFTVLKKTRSREEPPPQPTQPAELVAPKAKLPKSINDLQIGRFTIERKPDSTDSRIVGEIKNVSEHLHRKVKVNLDVLDAQGMKIGSVSDSIIELPGGGVWRVITTTTDTRARSVRVSGINEDP